MVWVVSVDCPVLASGEAGRHPLRGSVLLELQPLSLAQDWVTCRVLAASPAQVCCLVALAGWAGPTISDLRVELADWARYSPRISTMTMGRVDSIKILLAATRVSQRSGVVAEDSEALPTAQ